MTVEQFVAARRERWLRLSELCDALQTGRGAAVSAAELREFGALYRQSSSDLAYATAQLPNLELLAWLNRLLVRAHAQLYVRERGSRRALVDFCRRYPARWRAAGPFLLAAAALLFGSVVVAWVVVRADPRLAGLFMPVELTAAALPDQQGVIPPTAFVAVSGFVLTNNITAALMAFAGGLVFGLGAVLAMVRNGLLIGALAGLAHHASPGTLLNFLALLAPHGVLELFALVTCGAAGLMLGHALLAGGREPRAVALRRAGSDAIALLLGALPWFVPAALIEGLVTPLAAPPVLKLLVALLSGGILWYTMQAKVDQPHADDSRAAAAGARSGAQPRLQSEL